MDTGQWLVIGLCAFLFLWYAGGWLYNRRRGHAVLDWLRTGLGAFGKPGETRWLSPLHSSAQIILTEARSPFRKIGVVFVLEPRENLPVWVFRHVLGRRDELYLRADLRSAPAQEIEIDRKTKTEIASDLAIERLKEFVTRYDAAILRLSLQRQSPHLILRARLAPLLARPCEEFFAALQASLK